MASGAGRETVGVSMALFDDNFLTVLRNGMVEYAETLDGVDAADRGRAERRRQAARPDQELHRLRASTRSSSTRSTPRPPRRCRTRPRPADVPLVYVNREPINVDTLPDNQAFVASDERESGTLETKEVCRLLKEAGKTEANIYVMMGELSNQAARQRTQDIHDVIATPECGVHQDHRRADRRTGSRDEAQNLMTNWLSTGVEFDAVIANNDEMAIGAIQAMKAAGIDMEDDDRRRRRRDPGRAGGDAGGRPRRDGVPERGRRRARARSTRR